MDATEMPDLAEQLQEIRDAEAEAYMAEREVLRLKFDLKDAKEFYHSKVLSLREIIRAQKNDAERPLFNGAAAAATDLATGEITGADDATNAVGVDDGITAENWREQPLSKLLLTEKMIEKLNEASLISLGQLADYTNAGKNLTDIHGIGEAAAGKILQALENFWHLHPGV